MLLASDRLYPWSYSYYRLWLPYRAAVVRHSGNSPVTCADFADYRDAIADFNSGKKPRLDASNTEQNETLASRPNVSNASLAGTPDSTSPAPGFRIDLSSVDELQHLPSLNVASSELVSDVSSSTASIVSDGLVTSTFQTTPTEPDRVARLRYRVSFRSANIDLVTGSDEGDLLQLPHRAPTLDCPGQLASQAGPASQTNLHPTSNPSLIVRCASGTWQSPFSHFSVFVWVNLWLVLAWLVASHFAITNYVSDKGPHRL